MSSASLLWLIYTRELRAHRNAALAWLVPLAGLMVMYASLQPQVAGENGLLAAKLAMMPDALKQAFSLGSTDFSRPVGYLSTNFIMVTLGSSLFAGLLGAGAMAREELQRTSEALLTLPIARWQVLVGKLLAALTWVIVLNGTVGAVTFLSLARAATAPVEGGLVAAMFTGVTLLGACFVATGFVLALVIAPRAAAMANLGLVLGTYFAGVISKVSEKAQGLAVLSPYRLVEPHDIVANGLEPKAAGLLVVSVALGAFALLWYDRRDVHA